MTDATNSCTALQVVSALFDINPSMSTHMAVPLWKRCVGTLLEVLQLLQDEPWIQVDEFYEPPAEDRLEDPPAGQPAKVGSSATNLCTSCPMSLQWWASPTGYWAVHTP